MRRQFALFCVAGALAFVVDAGIVQVLVGLLDADPYLARVFSFACGVTTTWLFNRRYTFTPRAGVSLAREWRNYAMTQLGGLLVNFAIYSALLMTVPLVWRWPALGVAAGACVGLVVNFAAARRLVFSDGPGAGDARDAAPARPGSGPEP